MCGGCFSWCRLLEQWGTKKHIEENQLPIVELPGTGTPEFEWKSSEKPRGVVPTTQQYIMATGTQTLTLLQSAASIIPVPLLQEAIGVAIKIIEVCEEASAFQQKVKDLQERVAHIMIFIVENVTVNYEEGSEVVVKAVKSLEKDITDLLSTLKTINKELAELRKQNSWLQGLYTKLNMEAVESCLDQLFNAQEKFMLANELRHSNLLVELHTRLNRITEKIDDIRDVVKTVAEDVKDMATKVENISTYLSNCKQSATRFLSDTVVRQQMPLKPGIFHGRDHLVDEIAQLLVKKETAHVCL